MTWITLIPKVTNSVNLKDYRPISLIGSLYKIIAKFLSLTIKEVLSQIIDETQFAFIQERQILDGVLVANEAISWLKRRNR